MKTRAAVKLVVIGVMLCAGAFAAERKAYKHVDEKGNVTYSQTPPADAGQTKRIDIAPAQEGRGGYAPPASSYDNPRTYSRDAERQRYEDAARARQQRQEDARQRRLAELEADCNRNRGTDCKNPEALRYQDSTRTPGGYRR